MLNQHVQSIVTNMSKYANRHKGTSAVECVYMGIEERDRLLGAYLRGYM